MEENTTGNTSFGDPSELLQRLNDKLALRYAPIMIYLVLLMVSGIFGNILVSAVYLKKKLKLSSDYFILNLAFLDLITCFIGIPLEVVDLRYSYMFYSAGACKLFRTVQYLTSIGSAVTLMAIALDRYQRICKLGKRFSAKTAVRICILAVGIGGITCWPAAFLFGRKTVDVKIPGAHAVDCSTADEVRGTIYPTLFYVMIMLAFLFCVVFLTVIYVKISNFIRKSNYNQAKNRDLEHKENSFEECTTTTTTTTTTDFSEQRLKCEKLKQKPIHVKEIKVTRTTTIFVAVTCAFIISYLPFLILTVVRSVKKDFEEMLSPDEEIAHKLFLRSYFINNAINPIIYNFLNINFRKDAKRMLTCICCHK